jgi:hypothetical protein
VGTSEPLVYAAFFDNEETLHRRIVDACQSVHIVATAQDETCRGVQ